MGTLSGRLVTVKPICRNRLICVPGLVAPVRSFISSLVKHIVVVIEKMKVCNTFPYFLLLCMFHVYACYPLNIEIGADHIMSTMKSQQKKRKNNRLQ